ncbi:MAG: KH domain-containing protein [Desulfovibrionaceae bacterium]|nr:KH domain-containing protein [Desulfovibrionaceae bacterium]MBR5734856.1 KH domain-containing protein [Desulfovibrionaceae bacterium]
MLKELVEYVAKALVDKPEEVNVRMLEGDQTAVVELRVAKDDIGKIIGRQGRTVRALRTVFSAAASQSPKHVTLELVE